MKELIKDYWWKILLFIFILLVLKAFFDSWISAFCGTVLLFSIVWGVHNEGISKGEIKVLAWIEKKGYRQLSDEYEIKVKGNWWMRKK